MSSRSATPAVTAAFVKGVEAGRTAQAHSTVHKLKKYGFMRETDFGNTLQETFGLGGDKNSYCFGIFLITFIIAYLILYCARPNFVLQPSMTLDGPEFSHQKAFLWTLLFSLIAALLCCLFT